MRNLPLRERKHVLERLLGPVGDPVHFSAELAVSDPNELIRAVQKQGLEGVIAKKVDSPYESGQRTGAWLNMRTGNEQEFVVGGYRRGARQHGFDALMLRHPTFKGVREDKSPKDVVRETG